MQKIKRLLFELMQRFFNLRCTSVAIIIEEGESFLLFDRNDGKGFSLLGGLVDYGEKAEAAAVRELAEETGIVPTMLRWLNRYDEPKKDKCLVHVFEATIDTRWFREDCKEGTAVWIPKEALNEKFLDAMAFGNGDILRQYLLQAEKHNQLFVESTTAYYHISKEDFFTQDQHALAYPTFHSYGQTPCQLQSTFSS